MGKIVVIFGKEEKVFVESVFRLLFFVRLDFNLIYFVIGGMRGIGFGLVDWMVEYVGVKNVVVFGCSGLEGVEV